MFGRAVSNLKRSSRRGDVSSVRTGGTDQGPAPAMRIARVRWRDVRLWAGLALILISMIAGARLLSGPDGAALVWRASADLARGSVPIAEPVQVQLGDAAGAYLPAEVPIDGRMLIEVPAGALIPARAIGDPAVGDVREVTVPVDPLHAPVTLAAGDRVDVWATATDAQATGLDPASTAPTLVLPGVLVVAADREALGVGGEIPVVLQVPTAQVALLVQALRAGVIDLTAVPITDDAA